MTEYMVMVLEDEAAHAAQPPQAMAELIEKRARFADELRRAGRLVDAGRFRPSREGKRVRPNRVEDGPFAGEDKALGAYYWVKAGSVDEAAKLAANCPTLPTDAIDVRPLMKGHVDADKDAKPGKLFGFAVLGNAPNEDAWVQVMDRIDRETSAPSQTLPASFLGGVRLQPPTSGKLVERRATFDGPFLESKEVIGGVFFMRWTSLEDAVAWAGSAPFVAHGALEIRELWRS